MANVLTNFIVGLGFDLDQRSFNQATSSIDTLGSHSKQLAATMAGAFGMKALTLDFADATDKVGKFSQVFSVLPQEVFALGRALEQEGGSLDGLMAQIEGLERIRAMRPDELAGLFRQTGITGIDPSFILNAESATEAYIKLGDVLDGLSGKQRLKVAELFGIDEASIRLLSNGSDEVRRLAQEEANRRPISQQAIEDSAEFNRQLKDLKNNIGSYADNISTKLVPALSTVLSDSNSWLETNKELINSNVNEFLEPMADHIDKIAIAGGLLASGGLLKTLAGMARYIPMVGAGLASAATAAARLTSVGAAAAVAYGGSQAIDSLLSENVEGYDKLDAAFTKGIFDLTGIDLSRGGVYDNPAMTAPTGGEFMPTFGDTRTTTASGDKQPININVTTQLDGQVLDQRTIRVMGEQFNLATEELTTSTGG